MVKIKVGEEIIDEFGTTEGVRQGCPLSMDLFNVAMTNLEEIKKVQGRGVNLEIERIKTIAYTDDIVLMAENEEWLSRMLKELGKFLKRKGLELNADKTKIMCFRKAGERKREIKFEYGGKEIEIIKRFSYLRYELNI